MVELDLHLSKILSLKSDQHQSKSDQRFVELDRRLIIFHFFLIELANFYLKQKNEKYRL